MKKLINYSIILSLLLFVFSSLVSCNDDKYEEPTIKCEDFVSEIAEANIILSQSSWEWVESRNKTQTGTIVTTPQIEGKTVSLTFNLGQSVEEIENGTTTKIWQYQNSISSDTTLGTFNSIWIDATGNVDRNYYLDICPEALKLTTASSNSTTVMTYERK